MGAGGAVYAEDINPAAIDYINKRADREKLGNIHTVLGSVDDTKLPNDSVDAVLLLKSVSRDCEAGSADGEAQGFSEGGGPGGDHRSERGWDRPWDHAGCGGPGNGRGWV